MSLRSSLGPHAAIVPAGAAELDAMRRTAWLRQGVVVLHPEAIETRHPWLAQAARDWAIDQFGTRKVEK